MNVQPPRKKLRQQSITDFSSFKVQFSGDKAKMADEKTATTSSSSVQTESGKLCKRTKSPPPSQPKKHPPPAAAAAAADAVPAGAAVGVEFSKLRTAPTYAPKLPQLRASDQHTVLVRTPIQTDNYQLPFPTQYKDKWDDHHVKMPCSSSSVYPVDDKDGEKVLRNRWEMIEEALRAPITSSLDLEEAILKYNPRYATKWNFEALHTFFTEDLAAEETTAFFAQTFPKMVELALQMPHLCTQAIPLLKKQCNKSVTMSQQQCACLLANAFFCTFPRRNTTLKQSEYSTYPNINFNQLFAGSKSPKQHRKYEKLRCIISYFNQVTKSMPRGLVTFERRSMTTFPDWNISCTRLGEVHARSTGTIEDDGAGMLQIDFANKFIGGGVLNFGCVQEEIRFLVCPEMIVACLITEVLDRNESLIITGCQRYSHYTGYANTFKWAGKYEETAQRDRWQRLYTQVAAIDAIYFQTDKAQFTHDLVTRELNKAYCGFHGDDTTSPLPAVASGNWGCGAFRGDLQLKCLIQMMAAAEAKRQLCYFTFGDESFCDEVDEIRQYLTDKELCIGDICVLIQQYHKTQCCKPKGPTKRLFHFIYDTYCETGDTEDDSDLEPTLDINSQDVPSSMEMREDDNDSPDYRNDTP